MKSNILTLLFLIITSSIFSQSFYVDKNNVSANDANPGTEAMPWATIQHAANSATPGSTVFIKAGTYFETIWLNVSGTAGNYITFTNYNSDVVTIDGGSTGTQTLLFAIFNQDYIKIDGLNFQNATGNFSSGIYISEGSDFIEITNNKITNIHFSNDPNALVNSSTNVNPFVAYNTFGNDSCSDILVSGNEIFDCRTGFSEALTLSGNVENFEVSNNIVHDITNIGIDIAGGYGVSTNPATDMARNGTVINNTTYNCVSNYAVSAGIYVDGGHNILVEKNTSYGNGRGYEVGCEPLGHTTTNIIVRNNLAYNNLEAGIGIGGYDFTGGNTGKVTNSQILNNTFHNNNTTNIWNGELLVEYTENCTIKNNIFSSQNTENMLVVTRENSTGLTLDYNLYYHPNGTAAGKVDYEGAVYIGFTDYQTGSGLDANSGFADPSFTDATNLDFSILPASSAIDAGDPGFIPAAGETDFAGNARLFNSIVDIGAYEFQMALPVEFIEFYAQQIDNTVDLKWVTATEIDNSHFEIERAVSGDEFRKIGVLNARNQAANYHFTDKSPVSGLNYYRLKQVDTNGQFEYSPTVVVDFWKKDISIYPNPVNDLLNIKHHESEISFELMDLSGKIILSGDLPNGKALDLSAIQQGLYYLKIQSGNLRLVEKVVKK